MIERALNLMEGNYIKPEHLPKRITENSIKDYLDAGQRQYADLNNISRDEL